MWIYGAVVVLFCLNVHGQEQCAPGNYGDGCNQNCSQHCKPLPNGQVFCDKETGKCSDGCKAGKYGDQCDEPCSRNCQGNTCNQHNGHCTWGCIDPHIGVFCEIYKGITIVHQGATPTSSSKIVIPVVVTVLVLVLVLVCVVCAVIIFIWRKKKKDGRKKSQDDDPAGQELLPGPVKGKKTDSQAKPTASLRDTDLHRACRKGNLAVVKRILDTGRADVNSRGLRGMTPVMAAAGGGHRDVVEFLVIHGVDMSLVDDDGNNILHYACVRGDRKTVEFVLSRHEVDINSRGRWSRTPVMEAAFERHRDVVELLVSQGADVSLVDKNGNSILHLACMRGDRKTVEFVLELDRMDIDSRGQWRMTPVMWAARGGHRDVVELLVSQGADVTLVDNIGNNILHWACERGNRKTVEFILSLDRVGINSRGRWDRTPVMEATFERHRDVVELLLSEGADVSLLDENGNDILYLACEVGDRETVEFLLSLDGIDINCRGWGNRTPVIEATIQRHRDVVELLVSQGADVSLVDENGNNILHYACEVGDRKTVDFVLSLDGVDINSSGWWSRTPAMAAAWRRHMSVVEFLVGRGADVSLVDDDGNNILHLACMGGDRRTVEFVLSLDGVDVNTRNNVGQTAANWARGGARHQLADLLVSRSTR